MRAPRGRRIPQLDWRKASFCQNGECVEVAAHNGQIMMRKSTQPDAGYICFTLQEFAAFLKEAKAGKFDFAG